MAPLVLTVDDSAVIRTSVSLALKPTGVEIAEASNGEEGLEVLRRLASEQRRPSLILTDINMPMMDGISFIKQVKETDAKFVPILVLTTESEQKLIRAGKEAGAAGWLTKPFKPEQLLAVVRKFVR